MCYFYTILLAGVGGCSLYITADIILQQYFNKKRSLANGIAVTASAAAVFVWPPADENTDRHLRLERGCARYR